MNLTESVYEGKTRSIGSIAQITKFSGTAASSNTFICCDKSWSMQEKDSSGQRRIDTLKKALPILFADLASQSPDAHVALGTFSETADLLVPLGNVRENIIDIEQAIEDIELGSRTHMSEGLNMIEGVLAGAQPAPSFALFMSDGYNNGEADPLPIAAKIKQMNVKLLTVGIGQTEADVDADLMKAMASMDDDGKPWFRLVNDFVSMHDTYKDFSTRVIDTTASYSGSQG